MSQPISEHSSFWTLGTDECFKDLASDGGGELKREVLDARIFEPTGTSRCFRDWETL